MGNGVSETPKLIGPIRHSPLPISARVPRGTFDGCGGRAVAAALFHVEQLGRRRRLGVSRETVRLGWPRRLFHVEHQMQLAPSETHRCAAGGPRERFAGSGKRRWSSPGLRGRSAPLL